MSEYWCCERNGIGCDCGWYDIPSPSIVFGCNTAEEQAFFDDLERFSWDITVQPPFLEEIPF